MSRFFSKFPIGLLGLLLGFTPSVEAKELVGRMGLGYNAQFSSTQLTNGAPAISIKYGMAPRSMVEVVGGFYSGSNGSGVAALKYMYTLHPESYANFYFLLGGGFVSANARSGTEWISGLGAEFFIPGVDSVGISFEAGMSLENITSSSFVVKTFGVSFVQAGMHFYF
jgi:hypothetical protein